MTVPLWYKNIKYGTKTAKINTKTLKVLSLLRPIVHDTSKTAKITWFILELHWAMDVIMTSITSTAQWSNLLE